MKKTVTTGKRVLKDAGWHDDNGLILPHEGEWDPPMTEDEVLIAALSDPDNLPSTPEQLSRMRRVSIVKKVRCKLGLSQDDFARRFGIPVGTLRDWEQHRSKPDQAAESFLKVIAANPNAVAKALK